MLRALFEERSCISEEILAVLRGRTSWPTPRPKPAQKISAAELTKEVGHGKTLQIADVHRPVYLCL